MITGIRFALEKVAAPMTWTHAVGITWLGPIVGGMFLLRVREAGKGMKALLGALTVYALASRAAVALLMIVASLLRLGSHYDLVAVKWVRVGDQAFTFVPGSLNQIFFLGALPQLTFWVAYTVVSGLVGAAVVSGYLWAGRGHRMGLLSTQQPTAAEPES